MQTVEVPRAIFEEQRCCALLAGAMTLLDKVRKLFRIARRFTINPLGPLIGKRRELRIDPGSKVFDDLGQRIVEIFILAPAERIARHFDPRAKSLVIGVIAGDFFAGLLREHAGDQDKSAIIELGPRTLPIDFVLTDCLCDAHRKFRLAIHSFGGTVFESQKRGFCLDPAGKAGKRSVRTDHPMARHYNG
jgi:hypothetical protein